MLKWAAKKLGVGLVEVHLDDLADYIEMLAHMNQETLQQVAAEVVAFRQLMESKGIDVGSPIAYVQRKPAMLMRIEEYVEETAKKEWIKSMGMEAWLHTLRAAKHVTDGHRAEIFKELTLKMWRLLGQGAAEQTRAAMYPMDFAPATA
ncbi:hypothetical protein JCM14635_14050 [Megalodesulfovibrio paquesii]